jgi:hypothetical protein
MVIALPPGLLTPGSNHQRGRALIASTIAVMLSAVAPRALAQDDPAAEPEPQTVDSARGPINGSTRRIGLGGAFVAIAEDTEGVAINPASTAVRQAYSWQDWDYGFGIDFAIGAWLPKSDVYNQEGTETEQDSGVEQSTALFGSVAALINYKHAGLGISAEAQRNAATGEDQMQGVDTSFAANFGVVHLNVAYGFLDGQLLLGAGPRVIGMSFDRHRGSSGLLSTAGLGYETGFVVKPIAAQYRVAAAFKSAVNAKIPTDFGGTQSTAHVPWEVAMGFAYQFGVRPLNPPLFTAKQLARQRAAGREPSKEELKAAEDFLYQSYLKLQRRYVLVSSELSIVEGGGPVGFTGAMAMDRPVISPRVGLESEVIAHHLRLRAGSYYEPALIAGSRSRVHGTGGFDVRLFRWSVFGLMAPFDYWQLSAGVDAARSYLNTSFSIGFWH